MSGIKDVASWERQIPSDMDRRPTSPASQYSPQYRGSRETAYASPLAHPGPYVVEGGSLDEAAIRGRRPIAHRPQQAAPNSDPNKEQLTRFAELGVGLASVVAEHVLSHPCIVLRRQCQVHHDSQWYHLTPFSLVQTLYFTTRQQSLTCLWKGLGSTLMVKGMQVASETVISEATPLPREVTRHTSIKKLAQHILLKALGFVVTCPFYAASLVETVQSEIASERPGVFDFLREGVARLTSWSTPQLTRQLPVWKVLGPCVVYGVGHYVLASMAQYTVLVSVRSEMRHQDMVEVEGRETQKSLYDDYYAELIATFTGTLLADVALYPLETVFHRLLLQGTRTIIDNTDTGLSVVPIVTRYEGTMDCFRAIVMEEGFAGLYKGFGALIIQFACHAMLLKTTNFLFKSVLKKFQNNERPAPQPRPMPSQAQVHQRHLDPRFNMDHYSQGRPR